MGFGQFAATSQFYLYGTKHCTQTGYAKHRKEYAEYADDLLETDLSLEGKVYIVTGGNSGVGFEVAQFLASKGAATYLVCRNAKRGEAARQSIAEATGNANVFLLLGDVSLEADVRSLWAEFERHSSEVRGLAALQLDALVTNAGALLNERTLSAEGVEVTFASHLLFGTYLLGKLAIPCLEATEGGRMVVVSSGGMYNTKWPKWERAVSYEGRYDGQLAYAYAKRGQVLLCERWAKAHPSVAFMTSHPGWTATPAVDAAYGDQKKYLEPMRTPWEGAEGIAWLCVADTERLQSGGFYLDRKPQVKHMAGPFFTEGSHTKNTSAEVDRMMDMLEEWSTAAARPAAPTSDEAMAADLKRPLRAMSRPIDIQAFMGRWYVAGGILTFLEQEKKNCIEDYAFDHDNNRIRVSFKMNNAKGEETELLQRAKVVNETNTQWSLSPKFGVYLPLGIAYLVLDCDTENYSYTVIGVPDRSYVWIMGRAPVMDEATWAACVSRAEKCGYDVSKLTRVEHDRDMEKEGAAAGKGAEEPTAAEALAAEEPAQVAA
mmetsp:Transcript_14220/g.29888  ORF Transcript_14220/g.29888 Transcript_14220/m.29888 type:complete len:545 (-) Transcript_14220:185-1819(-)